MPALKNWHGAGKTLAIFSSGSVAAQQLFFTYVQIASANTYSATEDLNPLLSAYYDTVNAGPKQVEASYTKIAAELDIVPARVLFLSDNILGKFGIGSV